MPISENGRGNWRMAAVVLFGIRMVNTRDSCVCGQETLVLYSSVQVYGEAVRLYWFSGEDYVWRNSQRAQHEGSCDKRPTQGLLQLQLGSGETAPPRRYERTLSLTREIGHQQRARPLRLELPVEPVEWARVAASATVYALLAAYFPRFPAALISRSTVLRASLQAVVVTAPVDSRAPPSSLT